VEGAPERYETLKRDFLSAAIDVVANYLRLERRDPRLTANWAIPVKNYKFWEVTTYDRNQPHRQPGKQREICDGMPGATEAFYGGNCTYVADTHDQRQLRRAFLRSSRGR
jgi:hypothetical protein